MKVPPCGYWEKRHGSAYTGGGWPDMHIVIRGVSIEAELKAPGGKPSELQVQKLNQIDDAGCMALVLYPDDFAKFQRLIKYVKQYQQLLVDIITLCGLKRGWRT